MVRLRACGLHDAVARCIAHVRGVAICELSCEVGGGVVGFACMRDLIVGSGLFDRCCIASGINDACR